jgi:hypothetical protein
MANIYTNRLYLSTGNKDLRDSLMHSIKQTFRCDGAVYGNRKIFDCEIEFDSSWSFPQKEMEKLTKNLPDGNDLYIRVLSHEFSCEYVGFNIYAGGEWRDKFAE